MKIYIFDSWQKFMGPVAEHWRALGHEVKTGMYWGPELTEICDAAYFYPVDNNLKQASRKQQKPPGLRVVAEAVDIDIYAGHPGAVNWDYVDALVVMAEHTLALLRTKAHLPPDLPVHIVPGGVDLDRFTLCQRPRGYNIAWIGRLWIAKNLFGALQVFNELIKRDPAPPWRLWCLGQRWDPLWWRKHCEAYLAANPALAERVEFVEHVPDVNGWLEPMSFLLQTSLKEAFGYVVAEAAAKGVRPVVQDTNGALATWPRRWVFDTHSEAVEMFLHDYDPAQVRGVIEERYPLARRLERLDRIMGLT